MFCLGHVSSQGPQKILSELEEPLELIQHYDECSELCSDFINGLEGRVWPNCFYCRGLRFQQPLVGLGESRADFTGDETSCQVAFVAPQSNKIG